MSFDTWEIRNEILDAMAETLGNDPNIPEEQRKKFKAYTNVKKAEKQAEKLIDDAKKSADSKSDPDKDGDSTENDTDGDGE